jgi:hypothetical protein
MPTNSPFIPNSQRPKSVITTDGQKPTLRKCAKCEEAFYEKKNGKKRAAQTVGQRNGNQGSKIRPMKNSVFTPFRIGVLAFVFALAVSLIVVGPVTCSDGWHSYSIGKQGACSWHGGVGGTLQRIAIVISALVGIAVEGGEHYRLPPQAQGEEMK